MGVKMINKEDKKIEDREDKLILREGMDLTLRLAGAGFKYAGIIGGAYSVLKAQPDMMQFYTSGLMYILGEFLVIASDDLHHGFTSWEKGGLEKTI